MGLKQISVDSWKDSPSDKVTLNVQMQSLADGTDYADLPRRARPGVGG